jgi:acetolactate synthase I/II/III large subunit
MGHQLEAAPLPRHAPVQPEPGMQELQLATEIILSAENPIILAGNSAIRTHASRALRAFVHTTGIPVAETFMAKGLLDFEDPHALGTVGLQARDYEMAGFDDADVVIAVGYDLVEHAPEHGNPRATKRIVMIGTVAAEIDEFFIPEVELVGDIAHVLARLAAGCSRPETAPASSCRLRELVLGALGEASEMTLSRYARRGCCRTSARRSVRATCSSQTWACTNSGSAACSRRTNRERC